MYCLAILKLIFCNDLYISQMTLHSHNTPLRLSNIAPSSFNLFNNCGQVLN